MRQASETTGAEADERAISLAAGPLSATFHVGLAVAFFALSQPFLAWLDVLGVAVHLGAAALVWRGWTLVGRWVVLGSAALHIFFFVSVLGLDGGWGYPIFSLTMGGSVLFFRRRAHLITMGVLVLIGTAVSLSIALTTTPIWTFPDETNDALAFGNLVGIVVSHFALMLVLMHSARREAGRIAKLKAEVEEARQLGQYTLHEKIGEGGMGQVYRVSHALLRRPAALKLLPPSGVSPEAMRRFEREVQLTSELTHPNTVAIYDYGHTDEGVFYYVMEYLDGLDLETLVAQDGPQDQARVTHILGQLVEALAEAHLRGLVHRDIKPANVILCERGNRPDVVKVLDFGLVRDLEEDDRTRDDLVSGTPAYMSPEAIEDPAGVGPASDLYAVGAVAWFLLTGRRVFERETVMAVCAAHLHDRPVPPSEVLGKPVDEVLEEMVMGCLEKDPAHRPPSADHLRKVLADIALDHPWKEDAARAWWGDRRPDTLEPDADDVARPEVNELGLTVDVRQRGRL